MFWSLLGFKGLILSVAVKFELDKVRVTYFFQMSLILNR